MAGASAIASAEAAGETNAINTCTGAITSEGDSQLNAATARTQFDVDGTGVKVGVVADSFNVSPTASRDASVDVVTGDLPGPGNPCGRTTPVEVLSEATADPRTDEGRAMLGLIHDIAPGADLAFASAGSDQASTAAAITALAAAGADVIVDSRPLFRRPPAQNSLIIPEPLYQDGPIAQAINGAAAQGVVAFTPAGNTNSVAGANDIGAWETTAFRSAGTCAAVVGGAGAGVCEDFDPGAGTDQTLQVTVPAQTTSEAVLYWGEPFDGAPTDLDLYVSNAADTANVTGSTATQNGSSTSDPVEVVRFANTAATPTNFNLRVGRFSGTGTPPFRIAFLVAGTVSALEYPTSGPDTVGLSIDGHAGASGAATVAAVPSSDATTVQPSSARGPVTHLFGPVNGATPAAALGAPEVLAKPDVAATGGARTTFFGDASNRYFGTHAAAAHAAGVAALQLEANANQTPAQVIAAQRSTATPVGTFGASAVGGGLLNALAAVPANPPPAPSIAIAGPAGAVGPTPQIPFTVSGDPKSVTCSIDGGAPAPCASPFAPPAPFTTGQHSLAVSATDYFGATGEGTATFSVDATGPSVKLKKRPKRKTTKRKAKFKFSAEPGATMECRLDKGAFARCTSPHKVRVKRGRHRFTIAATDALGNKGPATTYKWKVKRQRAKGSGRGPS